jgi:GNAT superfamily N-acetyltransferase
MIDPLAHGSGIGSAMMERVLEKFSSENVRVIDIAASQKSAPFFARFGAVEKYRTTEGWGPGLDRVEMQLTPGGPV